MPPARARVEDVLGVGHRDEARHSRDAPIRRRNGGDELALRIQLERYPRISIYPLVPAVLDESERAPWRPQDLDEGLQGATLQASQSGRIRDIDLAGAVEHDRLALEAHAFVQFSRHGRVEPGAHDRADLGTQALAARTGR